MRIPSASLLQIGRRSQVMEVPSGRRARSALLTVVVAVFGGMLAPAARAGTVAGTVPVRGGGSTLAVEGGNSASCSLTNNFIQGAQSSCAEFVYEQAFEAWVWLRATPSNVPAGNWGFAGWQNCDTTRV